MTKTEKVLQFDTVKAELDKHQLALFDIVNGKFKPIGVRIKYKDYNEYANGGITMKISPRAMPLFLVVVDSGSSKTPRLYTDDEIETFYRENPEGYLNRMLYNGRCQLIAKYLQKCA